MQAYGIGGGFDDQYAHDGDKKASHKTVAASKRNPCPRHAACRIADSQRQTHFPQNLGLECEIEERAEVRRKIDGASAGASIQEVEAVHPDEDEHQKTAGAGAEKPVVETDQTEE